MKVAAAILLACMLGLSSLSTSAQTSIFLDGGYNVLSSISGETEYTNAEGEVLTPRHVNGFGLRLGLLRRLLDTRTYLGVAGGFQQDNFQSAAARSITSYTLSTTYRAYLLDIYGDCDCPKWKKEDWFKKAFFAELSLGYAREVASPDSLHKGELKNTNSLTFGAGLGLTHRISDKFELYGLVRAAGFIPLAEEHRNTYSRLGLLPTLGVAVNL